MSGAGKSTLVRCINMLEKPTSGEVIVNGKRLDTMSPAQLRAARRNITMIFQQFNLLMQRNCLKNVCFPMELAGASKKAAQNRAKDGRSRARRGAVPPLRRRLRAGRPSPHRQGTQKLPPGDEFGKAGSCARHTPRPYARGWCGLWPFRARGRPARRLRETVPRIRWARRTRLTIPARACGPRNPTAHG